jgi:hypothetical protein
MLKDKIDSKKPSNYKKKKKKKKKNGKKSNTLVVSFNSFALKGIKIFTQFLEELT